MLAELRTPDGRELDLTLTTNGAALRALAQPLADAGLRRVTVSLDSLDDAVFGAMNGIDFPVAKVLDGIDAALEAGLTPVKVNMVVRRGINEGSIVPMARWARETGVTLRFIEYMDVGHSNGWRLDEVVPGGGAGRDGDLERGRPNPRSPRIAARSPAGIGTSTVRGEFGIISSVTRPFCRDCTRARLSADGKLYTCLFAVAGRDVRAVLRDGSTDDELLAFLADTWRARDDRYSELRSQSTSRPAADRDVRDGRLTGRPRRVPRPSVHRVIHTPTTPVRITWTTPPMIGRMFVDKRVDPSPTRPIP